MFKYKSVHFHLSMPTASIAFKWPKRGIKIFEKEIGASFKDALSDISVVCLFLNSGVL